MGQYQFSILKESDRFVRVKVSRLGRTGTQARVDARLGTDILDGIFLVEQLDKFLEVIPFQFSTSKRIGRQFTVTYRYDLENPHGVEAYEQAVRGSLKLSDKLAFDDEGRPTPPLISGVEKLETRTTDGNSDDRSRRLEVMFFLKRDGRISHNEVATEIITPNGTRHFFESSVSARTKNRHFLGKEKMNFDYVLNLDVDRYEADPSNPLAMQMYLHGKIEDSHTKEKEMMNYILMAEDTIGKMGIYPRPPRRADPQIAQLQNKRPPDGVKFNRSRDLGKSRIEFELNLDNLQLNTLLNVPEEDMWGHLESGFNVHEGSWSSQEDRQKWSLKNIGKWLLNIPLFIADLRLRDGAILGHAKKVKKRWVRATEAETGRDRAEAIARMFYDRIYHYDLIRMIRSVLQDQEALYFTSAYSQLFGRVKQEGQTRLNSADTATQEQERIDRIRSGRDDGFVEGIAKVNDLHLEPLDDGKWQINFRLLEEPHGLYFKMQDDKKWYEIFKRRRVKDVLVYNSGQFRAGENRIVIDPTVEGGLYDELFKMLESGKKYLFKAAVNPDGLAFGPKASFSFAAP